MWHRSVYFTSVMGCKWFGSRGKIDVYCTATHVQIEAPHISTHIIVLNLLQPGAFEKWKKGRQLWKEKWKLSKGGGVDDEGESVKRKGKKGGRERKREWGLEWLNNGFLLLFSFLEGSEKHRKLEALGATSLFLFPSVQNYSVGVFLSVSHHFYVCS